MKTEFAGTGRMAAIGALVALLTLPVLDVGAGESRPNVIIINIDNHAKGSLSCFGNEFIETPNIDQLFERGIRLQNFHTAGRCTSSRSALMTGRYHARNGALGTGGAWGQTVEGVKTIAHVFREAGYQTSMFGKWHLGDSHGLRPEDRGFDEVCSFENGAYLAGAVVKEGYNGSSRTAEAFRFNHNGTYEVYEGFRTDIWVNEINQYLETGRAPDKPFFIYLATISEHGPHFGPKDLQTYYRKKYQSDEFKHLREKAEKPGGEKKNEKRARKESDDRSGSLASYPYDHAADVASVDRNVGRLMAKLKELDLLKNTIVVYMSDGSGGGPASVQVENQLSQNPAVILMPGQTGGRDVEQPLVANIDILPTFAEICGLELSADHRKTIDGQSFASVLGIEIDNASPWTERCYIYDHQSTGDREGFNNQMVLKPFNMTRVTLPDGTRIQWSGGELKGSAEGGPDAVAMAKAAYEKWFARVLKDFPLGAFMKTHTHEKPIFLRSYPIADGPGGEGVQPYFLLDVAADGAYEFDTNYSDYFGAKRSEDKNTPATFTLFRKEVEGHLPVELDETMDVYRVLPKTLKTAFKETGETGVCTPMELKAGRYLVHIHRPSRNQKGKPPTKTKIRVQRKL